MCKKKGRLYTKAKKAGVGWEKFVEYQKATHTELKKAHWQYINGVLVQGLAEGDQKPFWRYIRSQRQDNQGVSPLRSGSQLCSDALTKARLLSEQFSSVFTKDTPETDDSNTTLCTKVHRAVKTQHLALTTIVTCSASKILSLRDITSRSHIEPVSNKAH